jgi:hypothetical protein
MCDQMNGSDAPRDLYRYGKPAIATVLKRWETGLVFNGNPQICLLLEVRPAHRGAFRAEVKTVVDRLHYGPII